jgi:hypothetical protein
MITCNQKAILINKLGKIDFKKNSNSQIFFNHQIFIHGSSMWLKIFYNIFKF